MNRRDFLRLRTDARRPVFELSCERLFMVYADRRESTDAPEGVEDQGEPTTGVERATAEEVFRNLERRLSDFEILRVLESGRLSADEAFGARVRALLEAFEARGGRVEFPE